MAPKSKGRAVLKKTKKVVEETVQVYIIDDSDKAAEIAMEEGMEFGKDAGGEVTRTTVIIEGDEETEDIGEGREKRVEILIESQNLEEPVLVTPRKEEKKKGAEDQGTRETEKGRRPEAPSDREKERGKVVEEWQEAGEDTGEGGNGVTEEETRDEALSDREKERGKVVEERQEAGEDTGEGGNGVTEEETRDEAEELESEKGDETREESEEPETEKGDKTGEPEEEEGLVKTPEKKEIGRTGERDGGVVRGGGTKNRKRRRRRGEGTGGGEPEQYKRYVYRVLKQVHPELGISSAAMEVLNAYMNDMFERLADEAAKLSRFTGRKTLSSREVQSAVRLVLPGQLGRHAIAEGSKAVTNYMSYGE